MIKKIIFGIEELTFTEYQPTKITMKNKPIYLPILLILMSVGTNCVNKKTASQAEAFFQLLKNSPSKIEDAQGNVISTDQLIVERKREGNICKTTVRNIGNAPLLPANIIQFDLLDHGLDPKCPVYGEGFHMLAQNGGTLDSLRNIGPYPDSKHYRIPNLHGLTTAYGVLAISTKSDDHLLLGFTSCRHFIGRISCDAHQLLISFDAEGMAV